MDFCNKLVFVPEKPFQFSLVFVGKSLLKRRTFQVLHSNTRLDCKGLLTTNTSLLRKSINYGRYKFYDTGPWRHTWTWAFVQQPEVKVECSYLARLTHKKWTDLKILEGANTIALSYHRQWRSKQVLYDGHLVVSGQACFVHSVDDDADHEEDDQVAEAAGLGLVEEGGVALTLMRWRPLANAAKLFSVVVDTRAKIS
jgi:hypothetical protein